MYILLIKLFIWNFTSNRYDIPNYRLCTTIMFDMQNLLYKHAKTTFLFTQNKFNYTEIERFYITERNMQIGICKFCLIQECSIRYTVKPVLSGHSKRGPNCFFKTDYRLMQDKSIAECSKGSILQYFRPSLSYHLSLISLFCLFLSGRLRQVLLYLLFNFNNLFSNKTKNFMVNKPESALD